MCETLSNGLRKGVMRLAQSKSHAHRVLIAEFLSGRTSSLADAPIDCDDILATKRCLRALSDYVPPLLLSGGTHKPCN